MTCKDVQSQLANRFDRDALSTLPVEVTAHLQSCATCQRYLEQLEQLDRGIRQLREVKADGRISTEELQKLADFAREKQFASQRRPALWQRAVLVAAAAILIALGSFLFPKLTHSPAPRNPELYLHSLESQPEATATIVFQSENEQRPVIIWIN